MIARELTEFFAGFSPNGGPGGARRGRPHLPLERERLLRARLLGGDPLRRRSPTPRTRPSAGRCSRRAGSRSSTRGAAVLHAHDYGPVEFMQRYFDEYRGLREASGHVEPLRRRAARARGARATLAGCASRAWPARAPAALAGALGGAPGRPPGGVRARLARRAAARRACSARCRSSAAARREQPGRARRAARAARWRHGRAPARTRRCCAWAARARRRWTTRCPGMADAAAARGRRDPALPARQRRPQHDLHAARAARGDGPHLLGLAPRPAPAPPRGGASVLRRRIVEEFAPLRAPVHKGFDDWYGRRRGARHRLGHRLRRRAAARLPRPRLPRPGPRARVLRHLGRVALGRAHLRARPLRDRGEPLAARPARASATGSAAAGSGSASTTASTARGRSSAAATPSSSTPASSRRGVPCRSARSRSRSCTAAGPDTRFVLFGQAEASSTCRSSTSCSASTGPEVLVVALLRGDRRASASRSPTTP